MFTIEQIKLAHAKVKSGADFPNYIQELKKLGVTFYTTYVADGHTDYFGMDGYKTFLVPKYEPISINSPATVARFQNDLKAHQQGQTDYLTFCKDAASTGVEKWCVSIEKMTCTYYDKAGNEMLVESIPAL